jgi:endothelin-converting enzyme/putative endopeptidase
MYKSTTDQGKAINLFNSILDTVARDKQDIAPLRRQNDKVKTLKTCKVINWNGTYRWNRFFFVGVGADDKNSSKTH